MLYIVLKAVEGYFIKAMGENIFGRKLFQSIPVNPAPQKFIITVSGNGIDGFVILDVSAYIKIKRRVIFIKIIKQLVVLVSYTKGVYVYGKITVVCAGNGFLPKHKVKLFVLRQLLFAVMQPQLFTNSGKAYALHKVSYSDILHIFSLQKQINPANGGVKVIIGIR